MLLSAISRLSQQFHCGIVKLAMRILSMRHFATLRFYYYNINHKFRSFAHMCIKRERDRKRETRRQDIKNRKTESG